MDVQKYLVSANNQFKLAPCILCVTLELNVVFPNDKHNAGPSGPRVLCLITTDAAMERTSLAHAQSREPRKYRNLQDFRVV